MQGIPNLRKSEAIASCNETNSLVKSSLFLREKANLAKASRCSPELRQISDLIRIEKGGK